MGSVSFSVRRELNLRRRSVSSVDNVDTLQFSDVSGSYAVTEVFLKTSSQFDDRS